MQGLSLDYALPKNEKESPEMPPGVEPMARLRYSHFGCNVIHEDLCFAEGVDVHKAKMAIKKVVENTHHGKLPAEHGHGTEYNGPPSTQKRWMSMDPTNVLNPGIGGLSYYKNYNKDPCSRT
eukprot:CAMPEP_0197858714 /NCGR_PEP_ID=MMETSP1438-20131217/32718_1 /TAXON_ID=1461541 /ORGANISM="Pterosperma sp., Strain CCMP1384" /LENGTH=121 /DNA_ID=CAMNT_0043474961 /DNA_START=73 /DNA_END=438 /DNA_ORIENTATION=-